MLTISSPDGRAQYVNEILDGGDEPLFQVTAMEEGREPVVITAATSSGAWAEVGKRVNDCRERVSGKRMFTQISGPEMFGYAHPTIIRLLQELPGAEKLDKYERQAFEVIASSVSMENPPVVRVLPPAPNLKMCS